MAKFILLFLSLGLFSLASANDASDAKHRIAPFYQLAAFDSDSPGTRHIVGLYQIQHQNDDKKDPWNISLKYFFKGHLIYLNSQNTILMTPFEKVLHDTDRPPIVASLLERAADDRYEVLFAMPPNSGSGEATTKIVKLPQGFKAYKIFNYDENQILVLSNNRFETLLVRSDGDIRHFIRKRESFLGEHGSIDQIFRIEGHGGKRFLLQVISDFESDSTSNAFYYVEHNNGSIRLLQSIEMRRTEPLEKQPLHSLNSKNTFRWAKVLAINGDRVWLSYSAYVGQPPKHIDEGLIEIVLQEPPSTDNKILLLPQVLTHVPSGAHKIREVNDIADNGDLLSLNSYDFHAQQMFRLDRLASGTGIVDVVVPSIPLLRTEKTKTQLSLEAGINKDILFHTGLLKYYPFLGKGRQFYSQTSTISASPLNRFFSTVLTTLRQDVGKKDVSYLVLQKPEMQLWKVAPQAVTSEKLLVSKQLQGKQFALIDQASEKVMYFTVGEALWVNNATHGDRKVADDVIWLEPAFADAAVALTTDGTLLWLSGDATAIAHQANAKVVRVDAKTAKAYILHENHSVAQYELTQDQNTAVVANLVSEWTLPKAFDAIALSNIVISENAVWALNTDEKRVYRFDRTTSLLQSIDLSTRIQSKELWGVEIQLFTERDGMLLARAGQNLLGLTGNPVGPSLSLKQVTDGLYGSVLRRAGVPMDYRWQMTPLRVCEWALLPEKK